MTLEEKLASYKPPARAVELIKSTKVVFMVGVSAAGKDAARTKLLKTGKYHHIVSHTTRKPRANHGVMEQDGHDYHFIDLKTAERMVDNHAFVEAKYFSDNIYGTSIAELQLAHDEGKIALTDIEVQGVVEYKNIEESVIPIFLLPPDYNTWQKRLEGRYIGQSDPEDIKKRMLTAQKELQEALEKPYFEYVVNEDLDKTVKIIDEIAHGNFSSKKNDQAREVARKLLEKLA